MMESEYTILQTTATDLGWEFIVGISGQESIVTLSQDYYFLLTKGTITPEQLLENSLDFLMSREPAASILPEFDLKDINLHYPEFESQMTVQ